MENGVINSIALIGYHLSSSIIHRPSSIVHRPSSIVHRSSSIVHRLSSILHNYRPWTVVRRPQVLHEINQWAT